MRTRTGLSLAVVAATLLVSLIGVHAASGQTVLHVIVPAESLRARFIDPDGDGLRLADRVASRGRLTDAEGMDVGMAYGDCVVHRRIRDEGTGLWTCNYVLDLGDGELVLQGLDPRGPGEYEMAVLGGTGAYANASGDATFTDEENTTDMVIRLSD